MKHRFYTIAISGPDGTLVTDFMSISRPSDSDDYHYVQSVYGGVLSIGEVVSLGGKPHIKWLGSDSDPYTLKTLRNGYLVLAERTPKETIWRYHMCR